MPPLRVAVIGAGAFGRNHLRVYRELENAHPDLVQLAALVEPDADRRSTLAATYNIPAFATVTELLAAPPDTPHPTPTNPGAPFMTQSHRVMGGVTASTPAMPPANPGAPDPASGTRDRTTPDLSSRPEAASFATQDLSSRPEASSFATPDLSSRPEAAFLAAAAERPAAPSAASPIHGDPSPQPQAATNPAIPHPTPTNPGAPGPASGTRVDAASICVPTIHHAAVAEQLLLANVDILIEKPFAATLAEADHLCALAKQHNRIVAIGHLERFNPAVTATLAALNQPMFFEAHRLSIFTPRSLDVDVVLDLMIHDLDIVLSLTNSPVKEVRAVGLPILSRKTDIANVRVEFASGCVANFTASRVSTEQVRKLRLFQPHQYLSLDFARQELLTISVDPSILAAISASTSATQTLSSRPERSAVERPAAPSAPPPMHGDPNPHPGNPGAPEPALSLPKGPASRTWDPTSANTPPPHPTAGLTLTHSGIPKGEPLRLELEDFLHAVRTRTAPRVPAEAGRAALALALTINEQIAAHAHRTGLL